MTDTTASADERLAYRGVFQRLFIRPEIGAMIGVVGIWVFFWAVAIPFGTANGFANIIDYSSTLGIMAVAVSMLMIGGEFDLSSGANTGAMGILVILLSKEAGEFGGLGLSLWIAIPISLVVALAIGYFNGWMVERTQLPSFIITLATYYVLIGSKLGFSKLIVDQIQVGDIRNAHGYDFWFNIFAKQWERTKHQFGARDTVYTILVLAAIAVVVLAICEMHFSRSRSGTKPAGLVVFLVGLAGTIAGIVVLHVTDGVSGNVLGAAVIAVGTLIALVGFGRWRFEPIGDRGGLALNADVLKFVGIGLAASVLLVVSALAWDADDATEFIFPWTKQGFRATLCLVFGGVAAVAFAIGANRARRLSVLTKSAVVAIMAVVLAALAFFVRQQSESVKFRSEAFSVMLGIALLLIAWAVIGSLYEERTTNDAAASQLGARMIALGLVLAVIGLLVKLLFTTPDEIEAGIPPAQFSMRNVWFIVFTVVMVWILGNTRFGSWTFAVGGNKEASRQVGVPAARTKTQLFMLVSGAAWLVGMLLAFRLNTIQASTGDGLEFQFIIAAVVGGTLLSGGYGTALGGALGAVIIAMATLGIPFARWNSDWRFMFLGVILLLAVIANRAIRTRAEAMRR